MYMINHYQLLEFDQQFYLYNHHKGIRLTHNALAQILKQLKTRERLEISEEQLQDLARQFEMDGEQLKKILVEQLGLIKPLSSRKFTAIYINSDEPYLSEALVDRFKAEYQVVVTPEDFTDYQPGSLLLFFRKNYSHADFKRIYQSLPEQVYLITAGVVYKILMIDNLYYKGSGLPSHFSNFNQLLAGIHSQLSLTKNNWLLFYRALLKNNSEQFPDPEINQCQKGYISHCLANFASQFTDFWNSPATLDAINWFWHVDLDGLNVFKEVAVHSAYSEYDMNLNLNAMTSSETTCC